MLTGGILTHQTPLVQLSTVWPASLRGAGGMLALFVPAVMDCEVLLVLCANGGILPTAPQGLVGRDLGHGLRR